MKRELSKQCLLGALLLCAVSPLRAQQWTNPVVVGTITDSNAGVSRIGPSNALPWVAVWQSRNDGTALYSRSATNGSSWGAAQTLTLPSGYFAAPGFPAVGTDATTSTAIAAWPITRTGSSIPDLALARFSANLTGFTPLTTLSYNGGIFSGLNFPAIVNGNNAWVLAASSVDAGNTDEGIVFYRSTTNGDSWQVTGSVGEDSGSETFDRNVALATDNNNHLVAVFERRNGSTNSPSFTTVQYASSQNGGASWSLANPLNISDSTGKYPTVAAGAASQFIAAYAKGNGANSLLVQKSTNGGLAWGSAISVLAASSSATQYPENPSIAADSAGNAVIVWSSSSGGTGAGRLYYSTSPNFGQTWSTAALITDPGSASTRDEIPHLTHGDGGRWVVSWRRSQTAGTSSTLQVLSSQLVFPNGADLSVTQSHSPEPASPSDVVTYNITVKNDGPSSATDVVAIDTLPTSASIQSISQSQGTHTETSGTVTFNIGNLTENASATATISMIFGGAVRTQNIVTLTNPEIDPDTDDRTSTEPIQVLIQGVDLEVKWTSFTYTLAKQPAKGRLKLDCNLAITNLGTKTARANRVLVVFSYDDMLSADDPYAHVFNVDRLGAGKTRNLHWQTEIPRFVPWFGRSLLAIADSEFRVPDADRTNNQALSDPLPVPDDAADAISGSLFQSDQE